MEMANGIASGQDSGTSNPGLTSGYGLTGETTQSVHEPAPSAPVERAERTFTQSEVDQFVKRAKADVRRTYAEQPEYAQQRSGNPLPQNIGNNAGYGEDHVKRIVSDTMQQMREQWLNESQQRTQTEQADRIIKNFWSKVNPAKDKYSDFDQVTSNIGLQSFPNTVQLLAEYVDNSGDVLYALAKDMGKLATIENWCKDYPQVAVHEVQKLAQSLKDNEVANKVRIPNEPLSQLQPKNVGMGNGNSASVKDWRARFKGMR